MNTENPEHIPIEETNYSQPGGHVGAGTVKRDHVFEDFKASQAILGIPAGEVSDKVNFLEREWNDWSVGVNGTLVDQLYVTTPDIINLAHQPLRIFRLQIRELALAYAEEVNNRKANLIQAGIGAEFIRVQQQLAEFRKFLAQHFEADVDAGVARNLTVFQVAQDVILRGKPRWFEFWRR